MRKRFTLILLLILKLERVIVSSDKNRKMKNGRTYRTRILFLSGFIFLLLLITDYVKECVLKVLDPVIDFFPKEICTSLYLQKIHTYHIISKMRALRTLCTYFWNELNQRFNACTFPV